MPRNTGMSLANRIKSCSSKSLKNIKNRVGGVVTPAVLPQHRTYRSRIRRFLTTGFPRRSSSRSSCRLSANRHPQPPLGFTALRSSRRPSVTRGFCPVRAESQKLFHMGLRCVPARATLSDALNIRDWRIYHALGLRLIKRARERYLKELMSVELDALSQGRPIDMGGKP